MISVAIVVIVLVIVAIRKKRQRAMHSQMHEDATSPERTTMNEQS